MHFAYEGNILHKFLSPYIHTIYLYRFEILLWIISKPYSHQHQLNTLDFKKLLIVTVLLRKPKSLFRGALNIF